MCDCSSCTVHVRLTPCLHFALRKNQEVLCSVDVNGYILYSCEYYNEIYSTSLIQGLVGLRKYVHTCIHSYMQMARTRINVL